MRTSGKLILPDVIGIGPGRTGTSWMHTVLAGHVDLPRGVKETQFFSNFYHHGIEWYASHFRGATGTRPVAEICPYFISGEARARIRKDLPGCRFICTFRDPVEHAYSNYMLLRRYVWARGSFEEVLEKRPHIDRGNRYAVNLARWFEDFGRDKVHVTWYDELKANPQNYINGIADFIGIPRFNLPPRDSSVNLVNQFDRAPKSRHLAQNARHAMYWMKEHRLYPAINALERTGVWSYCYGRGELFPRLTAEQEAMLRERYLPEVEALENLLGRDLSAWKTQTPRSLRADDKADAPPALAGVGRAAGR